MKIEMDKKTFGVRVQQEHLHEEMMIYNTDDIDYILYDYDDIHYILYDYDYDNDNDNQSVSSRKKRLFF